MEVSADILFARIGRLTIIIEQQATRIEDLESEIAELRQTQISLTNKKVE